MAENENSASQIRDSIRRLSQKWIALRGHTHAHTATQLQAMGYDSESESRICQVQRLHAHSRTNSRLWFWVRHAAVRVTAFACLFASVSRQRGAPCARPCGHGPEPGCRAVQQELPDHCTSKNRRAIWQSRTRSPSRAGAHVETDRLFLE